MYHGKSLHYIIYSRIYSSFYMYYSCFQKGVTRRKLLLHRESENYIGGKFFFLFFSIGNLRDFLIFHKIVIYAWLHLFENSYKYIDLNSWLKAWKILRISSGNRFGNRWSTTLQSDKFNKFIIQIIKKKLVITEFIVTESSCEASWVGVVEVIVEASWAGVIGLVVEPSWIGCVWKL